MFDIIYDKNYDNSIGIGMVLYFHKHMVGDDFPVHFHFVINLFSHFIEIRIGRDVSKTLEEDN